MKKHLLCTSAIALGVAAAAPASAQDWDLTWGGFFSAHIGYSDVSDTVEVGTDFDGIDVYSNREITFTPSVTLDNGLTFGVNIQMEGDNSSNSATARDNDIDETMLTISGDSLGRIILGNENSAGYLAMGSVYTPGAGSLGINSGSLSGFVPVTGAYGFRQAGGSSLTEVAGNNDVPRITYFTPSFNGLTIGVSYAASGATNAANNFGVNRNAIDGPVTDIFDIGVQYSGSFGSTDIGLAARWGTGSASAVGVSDPETWGVGATVGFSGFTVGATYAENDNGAASGTGDQEGWSFGVSYDLAGPWTIGFDTYQGERDSGGGIDGDYEAYRLGASRSLGNGVSWDVYAIKADMTAVGGGDIDATIIGSAINLSF